MLLESEVGREVTSWSVELGDGDLALIRYTQYIDEEAPLPDAEALDAAVVEMVRGWAPAVEGELIAAAGATARDAARADLYQQLSRRLSRAHRARGRRRRHPAPVRARRAMTTATSGSARFERRRARPAAPQDLSQGRPDPAQRSGSGAREFRLPGARGNADRARPAGRATSTTSWSRSPSEAAIDGAARRAPARSSARSPTCCAARRRTTSSTSWCSTPGSIRRRWSGCAPGSAICARPAAASA